jgi:hypothetical protein
LAGDKFLYNNGGVTTEKAAIQSSTGAGDAGKIISADSTGKLDVTFMPTGFAADTAVLVASESLAAGEFVNIYNDTGTAKCRLADATTSGKQAHGFVLATVTNGSNATVYFEGTNNQVSGAVAGNVFLSDTAGGFLTTAPTGIGKINQLIGVATSATSINVEIGQVIVLA